MLLNTKDIRLGTHNTRYFRLVENYGEMEFLFLAGGTVGTMPGHQGGAAQSVPCNYPTVALERRHSSACVHTMYGEGEERYSIALTPVLVRVCLFICPRISSRWEVIHFCKTT